MRLRTGLAIILCLGFIMSSVASVGAGVVAAVIYKHKSNPEGMYAKVKQKKAMSDRQPILSKLKKK